ncbi:MAG: hypothetical protein UZ16_OP3001000811 [Candidatus Hinthialibacteria bacterium OLB16]|nr:MAG: hypothetical protein UZ16_OP3001000811 [Candidatus Hinthialibacteria bacterium OLB16]
MVRNPFGFLGGLHHRTGFTGIHGDRLFTEDTDIPFQGKNGRLLVGVIRGADTDPIQILSSHHLAVVGIVPCKAILFGKGACPILHHVTTGHQLDIFGPLVTPEMEFSDTTSPDNPDFSRHGSISFYEKQIEKKLNPGTQIVPEVLRFVYSPTGTSAGDSHRVFWHGQANKPACFPAKPSEAGQGFRIIKPDFQSLVPTSSIKTSRIIVFSFSSWWMI